MNNTNVCLGQVFPNDPWFREQKNIYCENSGTFKQRFSSKTLREMDIQIDSTCVLNMPKAWSLTTGSKDVVVALIELGFHYQHEDLQDNLWTNMGETGLDSNGIDKRWNRKDDDHNGYVDDVHGYDFAFRDPDPDCYSYDGKDLYRIQPFWHGTNVAGIVGAKGNNQIGTCGMCWDVSLMLLKPYYAALDQVSEDTIKAFRYAECIRYAVDNGANIINWSGTLSNDTSAYSRNLISEAFQYANEHHVLIVLAVGMQNMNLDAPDFRNIPASLKFDNVMKVTELDFSANLYTYQFADGRTNRSNYGKNTVDIGVPATSFTTDVYHSFSVYGIFGGSSAAAPVITGLAALMLSINPQLKPVEIKQIITEQANKKEQLGPYLISGGLPDAYSTLLHVYKNLK